MITMGTNWQAVELRMSMSVCEKEGDWQTDDMFWRATSNVIVRATQFKTDYPSNDT